LIDNTDWNAFISIIFAGHTFSTQLQHRKRNMTSRIAETIRTLDQKDNVSLAFCGLGDDNVAALADALQKNTSVTTIYLHDNQIGDAGATAFADTLQVNASVTTNLSRRQSNRRRGCNGAC
jgi:hypothetical protein